MNKSLGRKEISTAEEKAQEAMAQKIKMTKLRIARSSVSILEN